jgi:hypothetical protein
MKIPHGARETLVLLRIVVLETDLEFDGFEEVALLLLRGSLDGVDALIERILRDFRPAGESKVTGVPI